MRFPSGFHFLMTPFRRTYALIFVHANYELSPLRGLPCSYDGKELRAKSSCAPESRRQGGSPLPKLNRRCDNSQSRKCLFARRLFCNSGDHGLASYCRQLALATHGRMLGFTTRSRMLVALEGTRPDRTGNEGAVIVERAPVSADASQRLRTRATTASLRVHAAIRFFRRTGRYKRFKIHGQDFFSDKNVASIVLEVPNSELRSKMNLWARTIHGASRRYPQADRNARAVVS
jgi:hypothetical protein